MCEGRGLAEQPGETEDGPHETSQATRVLSLRTYKNLYVYIYTQDLGFELLITFEVEVLLIQRTIVSPFCQRTRGSSPVSRSSISSRRRQAAARSP